MVDEVPAPGFTAGSRLTVTVVENLDVLEKDWRRLDEDPLNSMHHGFDWCRTWTRCFQNRVVILKGGCDDACLFILPLEITRMAGVRVARFIAAAHSNLNTGLVDAAFAAWAQCNPAEVLHQLQLSLRQALSGHADLLLLQNMPESWRGRSNLFARLPRVRNQNSAYQLPLKSTFEETLAQLNAKARKRKFRVQSKRLEELGGYDYLPGTGSVDDQHHLLDLLFKQKARRFRAMGFKDVFADPRLRTFFHAVIDQQQQPDSGLRLEMHALRLKGAHEGHIAAVAGVGRKNDHVICEFSSIDEDVAKDASPGEFLFWQMIAGYHKRSFALFDFGIGDQRYKRSWAPQETTHYDVLLPITLVGHLAAQAYRAQVMIKSRIKASGKAYQLAQRIRAYLPI